MALRRLARFADEHPRVRKWLPPVNFISLHYAYFIGLCLIMSVVFWGSSDPAFSISYTDSLFLVVSAMTEAGLNTVNLSQMTTWQQLILFFLILLGSTIWVSIWTVFARKHVFERRFKDIVRAERETIHNRNATFTLPKIGKTFSFRKATTLPGGPGADNVLPGTQIRERASSLPELQRDEDTAHESSRPDTSDAHIAFADTPHPRAEMGHVAKDLLHFLAPGGHGEFHSLTIEQRERLGGCEYRALRILSIVVPVYFVLWQLLGCVALGAWMNRYTPEIALGNGINPWWLGIFNGVSAFNNSGMSLLDANMVAFQTSYLVLIVMGMMILAGNTAYPLLLRLIIWSSLKLLKAITPRDAFYDLKVALAFILKFPRRVYTNLFPSRPTWWLLFMLVSLNSVDWVMFELLNIGNPVIEQIPTGPRVLDGLFQALAVRSGGFYVVPISQAAIGVQFLYVVMMYISVYPVVITMRHSNVYEERSLGIYQEDEKQDPITEPLRRPRRLSQSIPAGDIGRSIQRSLTAWNGVGVPQRATKAHVQGSNRFDFVRQQVHGQLAHDLWWLVLAALIITMIETSHFNENPVVFSVFNVVFEVVSAYGTVGISTGVPTAAYSFSGAWHTASKLVLCLVMLRGRHRGLPVALDHAVRLPGEHLHREEEEDHRIRRSMSIRRD